MRSRKVKRGKQLRINGRIYICGKGSIELANNVTINSSRRSNQIGGDTRTILNSSHRGKIRIGEGSGLSNCTIVARESVEIGKNVRIGGSCRIYDTDFHSLKYGDRIEQGDQDVLVRPVKVKDGAFIGAFSIILKGVTIGEHSIIGTGSVVTKDVPDHEIWAGNPARFIRRID
jgi:acetyltransferase-like isoleucine patch superfamily enzyme